MLTSDKLTKALNQANEKAKFILAEGCTTNRGLAAQDAHRAVQEANEYLAAGDMLTRPRLRPTRRVECFYHSGGFGSLIDAFQTTVKRQLGLPSCFF
jgi:hypothetical protein